MRAVLRILVCVLAVAHFAPVTAIANPTTSLLWKFDTVNCFVYKKYRLTNGIYDSFKAASPKECFQQCALHFSDGDGYYQCLSWTYNLKTKKCSFSEANCGNEPSIVANYVPASNYWSACHVDSEDKHLNDTISIRPVIARVN